MSKFMSECIRLMVTNPIEAFNHVAANFHEASESEKRWLVLELMYAITGGDLLESEVKEIFSNAAEELNDMFNLMGDEVDE